MNRRLRATLGVDILDFFLNVENALPIVLDTHMATTNRLALPQLPEDERENPNIYPPPPIMEKLHFLEDNRDTLKTLNRMWTELKT